MLQSIREYTQGWIAGAIISVIILTFALWGIHSYFVGGVNNNVVAQVNGIDIAREQLSVTYERLRRQAQMQSSSTPITTKDEVVLKDRALQALINIEVLKQASLAQGFIVSNYQIDNYLQNMPAFQVDGQFSVERFQEVLSSSLLSTSEFLDYIKASLLIDQPKLGIVLTSFALPDETNYTISLVNQERDISYITIPLQYFLSQPIIISQDKIKTYYHEHQNEFMTPEQLNVEYVELSLKELLTKVNPTDVALKNLYNENVNSYTQPMAWKLATVEISVAQGASQNEVSQAKEKATAMVQALNKGEDFSKVAHDHSLNIVTQNNWVTLNQMPTELQKPIAELTKPDQVTGPIKTDKGFVIIKVVSIQEPKIQTFEAVKDKVKELYIRQRAEEKFSQLRDQLADTTYEHPDSLQLAAKTLGLPIKTSELFVKDKPGKDISQYKKVRDAAFSNDVLTAQNNSDVIQLNPETVVVLRVKSHITSALLPLNSVSKQIEEKLKLAEAELRAEKFAQDFNTKLIAGANPEELANTYHLKWNKTGYISRYATKVDSAILDTAFRLPNPSTVQRKVVYGSTRLPNGYAMIALNSVKQGAVTDQKQYAIFAEQFQNSEGMLEYELYQHSQTSKAKIKVEQ